MELLVIIVVMLFYVCFVLFEKVLMISSLQSLATWFLMIMVHDGFCVCRLNWLPVRAKSNLCEAANIEW